MIAALTLVLALQTKRPPDFGNAQLAIRFIQDVPTNGQIFYGTDLTPYTLTQTHEEYKGPPVNDVVDTPPLTFTVSKLGKNGWKVTAPTNQWTFKVLADANVVIPYVWRGYQGFTVLNAKTGAKLWSRKPGEKVQDGRTAINLVDGVLYQWDTGHFTATNPQTGDILWDKPMPARAKGAEFSEIQVKNGRVYIVLEVEKKAILYCLDAKTGAEVWSHGIGIPIYIVDDRTLPGIVVLNKRIVGYEYGKHDAEGYSKQSLFCLDASTGNEIWKQPVAYTGWPFVPQANEDAAFVGAVRKPSFLHRVSDGSLILKSDLRWAQLFGPYVLDIDDKNGLVIYAAASGERIGRIQLTQTSWNMTFVHDRLILTCFTDNLTMSAWRVYEVVLNK